MQTFLLETLPAIVALNYGGLHYWLFHASLLCFCLNVAFQKPNESTMHLLTTTYGGSTTAAMLIGATPFIVASPMALPTHLLARILAESIPQQILRSPPVYWTIKVGAEVCRSAIATTWFGHAAKIHGRGVTSAIIGTIAGSFGLILGSLSLKPLTSSPLIPGLLAAMMLYQAIPPHSEQEEHMARTAIVLWMVFVQHIAPLFLSMMRPKRPSKIEKSD